MIEIIKDGKVIQATEKAYRVVYKGLGYKPYNPELDDITKDEIMARLDEEGIEYNPRDRKEELYKLLQKE